MRARCSVIGLVPVLAILGGGRIAGLQEAPTSPDKADPAVAVRKAGEVNTSGKHEAGETPAPQPGETPAPKPADLPSVLRQATRRVVKLYGAAAGEEHGYATGVIASPDGLVVTVMGLFLETTNLRAVSSDGHVYHAEPVYRDEYRQLALLKLDRYPENADTDSTVDQQMTPAEFEAFTPADTAKLRAGDWIFSVGNNFKVAEGDEPVSVLKGIVSGRTRLDAEHGVQAFSYRGEVLVLDAITSTPGAPGSALIDLDGRWVGLVGEIVTARQTNTFLNYAYPIEEIKAFLADAQSGAKTATRPATLDSSPGYHGIRLSKIAYRRQLPFVQSVAPGSPAAAAGLKPDDLVVSANGTAIPHARIFNELCERLHAGDELSLVVKRGEELKSLRFTLTEVPK